MINQYIDKLERKFRRFSISNLMLYIILGMGVFYIADMVLQTNPDNRVYLTEMITFDRAKILQGEVWRVLSFVLVPPSGNPVIMALVLYFYWMMGTSLEHQWGSFRFNLYFFIGVIGCIIAGFIVGFATNSYIFLGMFLAYAIMFPEEKILLFFCIPIKVKWLGLIDGILLLLSFIFGGFKERIFIALSLANLILFFGKDLYDKVFYAIRRINYNRKKK